MDGYHRSGPVPIQLIYRFAEHVTGGTGAAAPGIFFPSVHEAEAGEQKCEAEDR